MPKSYLPNGRRALSGAALALLAALVVICPGQSLAQVSPGPLGLEPVNELDIQCLIDPVNCGTGNPLQNPPICAVDFTTPLFNDNQGDPGRIKSSAWQIGPNEFLYLYIKECHTGPNWDVVVLPVPVNAGAVFVQDVNADADLDETFHIVDAVGFMPYNQDPGGLQSLCQSPSFGVSPGDFITAADYVAVPGEIEFRNADGIFLTGNIFGFKACTPPQTVQVSPLGTPSEFGIILGENPTVALGPIDLCAPTPGSCDCSGFPCGKRGQKVTLCHVPPGNPGNLHTLCISPNAVPAHLANHPGDFCGPCF